MCCLTSRFNAFLFSSKLSLNKLESAGQEAFLFCPEIIFKFKQVFSSTYLFIGCFISSKLLTPGSAASWEISEITNSIKAQVKTSQAELLTAHRSLTPSSRWSVTPACCALLSQSSIQWNTSTSWKLKRISVTNFWVYLTTRKPQCIDVF